MKNNSTKTKFLGILFSALILLTPMYSVEVSAAQSNQVYVGGTPFGIRFEAGEVTVLNTNEFTSGGKSVSPAKDAGILKNDIIKSIDGTQISSMFDVVSSVKSSSEEITITVIRNGKDIPLKLIPQIDDKTGEKQLGVMLKDSSAGIGTITFINTDKALFAGLGHGICDTKNGSLMKISSGYISEVKINSITKGKPGTPGELCGMISQKKYGKLISNTDAGIFGTVSEFTPLSEDLIEVASENEVSLGKATILCTLDDNQRNEYNIEICEIDTKSDTKNFIISVTDSKLLDKTGGIVQGMSGSPIIQNGKLVGAVTHVLVNDPTRGFGISIENMLKEVNKVK